MFGWTIILLTWLSWVLIWKCRDQRTLRRAGILCVFLTGLLGGVELWIALVGNVVVSALL